jgi:hypothetical protein
VPHQFFAVKYLVVSDARRALSSTGWYQCRNIATIVQESSAVVSVVTHHPDKTIFFVYIIFHTHGVTHSWPLESNVM